MSAARQLLPAPHARTAAARHRAPQGRPGRQRRAQRRPARSSRAARPAASPASSAPAAGRSAAMGRRRAAVGAGARPPGAPGRTGAAEPRLTALPPARQAIIYTASLTVRAADVRAAAARAAQLASSAGGYVSSETARFSRRHPGRRHDPHPAEDPRRQLPGHARGAVSAARHQDLAVPAGAGRHPDRRRRHQPGGLGPGRHRPAARCWRGRPRSAACSWSRTRSTPRSPVWRRWSHSSARWRTRPRTGPSRCCW